MAALQANGYEVEIYEAAPATPAVRDVGFAACEREPSQGPPPAEFGPGPHHYVVEFVGPVKPEWLAEIEAHGGRALEPMPPASYIVALGWAGVRLDHDRRRIYVHSVVHYGAEMRVDAGLTETLSSDPLLARGLIRGEPAAAAGSPGVERVPTIFSVRFFEADDLVAALPAIRDLGGTPGEVAAGSTVTTVSFEPDDPAIGAKVAQLARLHGVRVGGALRAAAAAQRRGGRADGREGGE